MDDIAREGVFLHRRQRGSDAVAIVFLAGPDTSVTVLAAAVERAHQISASNPIARATGSPLRHRGLQGSVADARALEVTVKMTLAFEIAFLEQPAVAALGVG